MNYGGDGVRKKFTGYERDNETDLDFAQARYYSKGFGKFTSPDDFTNDTHPVAPQSWNLYVYVRNNPLALTDPEGEKIYAGDITDADDRAEFLKRANFTYGCSACVTIGKDGFLAVDTSGLSKDILKATQYLTDAINTNDPSKLFSVQITNNSNEVAFGDSQRGSAGVQLPGNNFKTSAIRIRLDFADDKWVSGNKDAKSAFLNLVFAHEVGHFYPDFITDPGDGRKTGPVVDKVNEIQQALGLPLRAEYSARQTTSNGPWVEVGFGKAKTDKAGQPLRDNGAIQVEKQNKVVRWVKNGVGGKGIN